MYVCKHITLRLGVSTTLYDHILRRGLASFILFISKIGGVYTLKHGIYGCEGTVLKSTRKN